MLKKDEQASNLLQKKPERQTGRRLLPFLVLPGVIIILGVVLVGAWQVYRTSSASSSTGSSAQSTGNTGKKGTNSSQIPTSHPAVYWQTLRAQFAQGMHMTEQQIQENMQSTLLATPTHTTNGGVELNATDAAKWLSDLTRARGISQNQLHTIEVTAVQHAYAVLVEQHVLTKQQANEKLQEMSQDDLNADIMSAFAMCSTGKASCQE